MDPHPPYRETIKERIGRLTAAIDSAPSDEIALIIEEDLEQLGETCWSRRWERAFALCKDNLLVGGPIDEELRATVAGLLADASQRQNMHNLARAFLGAALADLGGSNAIVRILRELAKAVKEIAATHPETRIQDLLFAFLDALPDGASTTPEAVRSGLLQLCTETFEEEAERALLGQIDPIRALFQMQRLCEKATDLLLEQERAFQDANPASASEGAPPDEPHDWRVEIGESARQLIEDLQREEKTGEDLISRAIEDLPEPAFSFPLEKLLFHAERSEDCPEGTHGRALGLVSKLSEASSRDALSVGWLKPWGS